MINRTASTQYNDWIGSTAFDDADIASLSDYVKKKGIIGSADIIYSFEASYNYLTKDMSVSVFYTDINFDDFKNSGSKLSEEEFDISVTDFYELFKRVKVVVAKKGI